MGRYPDKMFAMSAAASDRGDPLYSTLVALTKRKLGMAEIYEAVNLGSSQYNDLRKAGRLVTPDRVILAANYFGLNPVELLAECGVIGPRDAVTYVEERRREAAEFFGMSDDDPSVSGPSKRVATKAGKATRRVAKLSATELRKDVPLL